MANEDNNNVSDEDYLDKLLNSVVNNDKEEDLLGDLDSKLNSSISDEDMVDIFQNIDNDDDFSDNYVNDNILDESLSKELSDIDVNDVNVVDSSDMYDDDMKELFDMLNDTNESHDTDESVKHYSQNTQPAKTVSDTVEEPVPEDDSAANESNDILNGSDELGSLLDNISLGEDYPGNDDKTEDTADDNNDMTGNAVSDDNTTDASKDEAEAKQGFFARLFKKKKQKPQEQSADENERIIQEVENANIDELDELANLEDRTEKKKSKKEKKPREKKKKKPKEKKPKEKKPVSPDEIIHIPVSVYIFMITIVGAIAFLCVLGSNLYDYNSKMDTAITKFVNKEYDDAYELIAGLRLKDKDKDFVKQVITVMYVQKQYNSYCINFNAEDYYKALNALIKAVDKYNRYSDVAKELGVSADMNYVYEKVLKALKDNYNISEKKAEELAQMNESDEYISQINSITDANISVLINAKAE